MDQKVIIIDDSNSDKINSYLNEGWRIKSVTPQNVSTGGGGQLRGGFCFVIERTY